MALFHLQNFSSYLPSKMEAIQAFQVALYSPGRPSAYLKALALHIFLSQMALFSPATLTQIKHLNFSVDNTFIFKFQSAIR